MDVLELVLEDELVVVESLVEVLVEVPVEVLEELLELVELLISQEPSHDITTVKPT